MSDELLDIVDEEDRVTGQEMRSIMHRSGLQHRGIHIFLVTAEGKLLVQQRGSQRGTAPLALDCSVSEHVKAGEGYREAARRGLAEELGLPEIRLQALVKFRMDYGPHDREICTLYEGSVNPALVHFDPLEVEGVACYSLDELEMLIQAAKVVFSGWFIQLIRWYAGKPSEVQAIKVYTGKRRLLASE